MWRGTTPTYNFTLPEGVRLEDFSTVYLTFAQNGHNVLEKTKDTFQKKVNCIESFSAMKAIRLFSIRFRTKSVHAFWHSFLTMTVNPRRKLNASSYSLRTG